MKNIKLSILFLAFSALFFSCEDEPDPTCNDGILNQDEVGIDCGGSCFACSIEYPYANSLGPNLLHGNDTLTIETSENSFHAIVPEGSSLEVELQLINGIPWFIDVSTIEDWTFDDYENGTQRFTASGIEPSLEMTFDDSGSSEILVKYFENGNVLTKSKSLVFP